MQKKQGFSSHNSNDFSSKTTNADVQTDQCCFVCIDLNQVHIRMRLCLIHSEFLPNLLKKWGKKGVLV